MVKWMSHLGVSEEDVDKEMKSFIQERNVEED